MRPALTQFFLGRARFENFTFKSPDYLFRQTAIEKL